ncbi:MAG: ATP-binding cassette domain-containing protein [Candidatus Hydrogenedentes bacterium]|nr:ATP-binding cassette domain-containing protein [Candidatus Hydrogenedentota bacterium]
MIQSENLRKVFHASRGRTVEAVRGATFSVAAGEIFGLLGPNGAGKTTLLRMLGTIITPSSGHCWIAGNRTDLATDEVRHHIGFLSGNTKLYGRLTARELLRYFGRLYGMPDPAIAKRSEELAAMLGMGEFMERRCDTLSTGQSQKVSIARVLLHDPEVLILDEPTLGLDIMTSTTILDFILDAKRRGHCIIFSTHYMSEAELLCDRVGLIYNGSLLAIGTKQELYEATGTDNIQAAFLAMVGAEERKHA